MFLMAGLVPWTHFGDDLASPDHCCDAMPHPLHGIEVAMWIVCWIHQQKPKKLGLELHQEFKRENLGL
jgi:hypothetical protein